jgi:alpha-D-ribose 1-methylphosphonate 5-triphosphate synthase subunit PhnG
MSMTESSSGNVQARRRALGLLVRATPQELAEPLAEFWPGLVARDLKPAEAGLVMLRGRAGGDGAMFNLGEASVARAVIELETGERGYGHLLGRDLDQARRIAIFDALGQRAADQPRVEQRVLAPIAARLAAAQSKAAAETAATRVDFFTLVRGEDAA